MVQEYLLDLNDETILHNAAEILNDQSPLVKAEIEPKFLEKNNQTTHQPPDKENINNSTFESPENQNHKIEMSNSSEGGTTLQAGQIIKPYVKLETVKNVVWEKYGLKVGKIKELNSYDDKNYLIKAKGLDSNDSTILDNRNIRDILPDGYVFKILNSHDTQKPAYIEAQHATMRYLHSHGINCPVIILNREGQEFSIETLPIEKDDLQDKNQYGKYLVRMFNFIAGEVMGNIPVSLDLCYQAGAYIGRIDNLLQHFNHPGLEGHKTIWSLESVPKLTEFSHAIRDEKRRELANSIISKFSDTIIPRLADFKKGVIHGDFNEHNIIVNKDDKANKNGTRDSDSYNIYGVIDFGDLHISYYVFEISLCITYMMIKVDEANVLECGGHVLAGYLQHMELSPQEILCIQLCVCARLCQSLTMGEYTYSLDPGNEYLLSSAKRGWDVLDKVWNANPQQLYDLWDSTIIDYEKAKWDDHLIK